MPAPITDVETQKPKHRAPLTGMGGVFALTAGLVAVIPGRLVWDGDNPRGVELRIDRSTGELVRN